MFHFYFMELIQKEISSRSNSFVRSIISLGMKCLLILMMKRAEKMVDENYIRMRDSLVNVIVIVHRET